MKWLLLFLCFSLYPSASTMLRPDKMEHKLFIGKQHTLYQQCYQLRHKLLTINHGLFSCDFFLQSAIALFLKLDGSKEADDLLHYFEWNNFSFDE